MTISILLIDDHPLTRLGIARTLENTPGMQVNAQCADIKTTREWLATTGSQAEIALLDRILPDGDGLSLVQELKKRGIRTVMLTMAGEDFEISEAIEAGVDGYILKSADPEQLINAIQSVAQGNSMFPSHIMQKLARGELKQDMFSKLSQREREIVELVAQGLSNKAISSRLDLSENTVRNHLSNIMEKLGMQNRVQVATSALKHARITDKN
ncbi:DNA-binding response regulator [Sulfuriferula plumbiphila]|uniref:DNA-binding response regulator n=1 Tax=Sulfuriferula plumbiphila TaxID=171865 RepID=A0A512L565_9PROT|nr:response regulator transcription factor [Sulfuriferula plumbiphila]BBP05863.1 DNA-binding response regulator [Sulfuriferula plumbiphila]GEP29633.1 DNA-binding response regulator [Sulfuriferula plumbiphila]